MCKIKIRDKRGERETSYIKVSCSTLFQYKQTYFLKLKVRTYIFNNSIRQFEQHLLITTSHNEYKIMFL